MARIWNPSMKFRTSHSTKLMTSKHKQPFDPAQGKNPPRGERSRTTLKRKVFVGLSGGVDSSVAALLLKQNGYEVTGVFIKCWSGTSAGLSACSAEQDAADARRVAEHLQIPFYVFDFEKEYKKRVVEYMVEGYRAGITPNPDIECNREIKFGLFLKRALALGADYVATGHYVRLRRTRLTTNNKKLITKRMGGRELSVMSCKLFEAKDSNKDQSYFLWTLTQDQLKHCLFPIGDYLKSEVRKIARQAGLPTAEKKDSQGVCFLGQITLSDFLKNYIPEKRGDVVTISNKKIGEHEGAHFYTIGQRHLGANSKLQIPNSKGGTKPHFVAEKNMEKNIVTIAEGSENPALYRKKIGLSGVNFINPEHSNILQNVGMLPVLARVRYRQPLAKANLRLITNNSQQKKMQNYQSINSLTIQLTFSVPQKFVAPGQSAVFYERNPLPRSGYYSLKDRELRMLGGGVIMKE